MFCKVHWSKLDLNLQWYFVSSASKMLHILKIVCSNYRRDIVVHFKNSFLQSFRLVRERKRVAWILLLLAFVFAVCWLPYNTLNLMLDNETSISATFLQYMLLLGHANSALNPVIYCVMSRNFRRSVKDLMLRTRINFDSKRNHRLKVSSLVWSSGHGIRCRWLWQLTK